MPQWGVLGVGLRQNAVGGVSAVMWGELPLRLHVPLSSGTSGGSLFEQLILPLFDVSVERRFPW